MRRSSIVVVADGKVAQDSVAAWLAKRGVAEGPLTIVDIRTDDSTGDGSARSARNSLDGAAEDLAWFHDWSLGRHDWGSVADAMMFRGVSLWYFVQGWFFGSLVVPSETLRHTLAAIRRITTACDAHRPDWLASFHCAGATRRLVDLVAVERGIHAVHVARPMFPVPRLTSHGLEFLKAGKLLLRLATSRAWGTRPPESAWLLGMTLGIDQFVVEHGAPRFIDPLVDGVAAELAARPGERRAVLLEFDVTSGPGVARIVRQQAPYVPFERFARLDDIPRSWVESRAVRRNLRALAACRGFRDSFRYRNVRFWSLIEPRWRILECWRIPDAIRLMDGAERALSRLQPRAVLVSDELSRFGCALVTAARRRRIPTVNIQHGLYLDEGYPGFVPIRARPGVCAAAVPQADIAAVFNQQSREFVIRRGAYGEEAVRVVGRPGFGQRRRHAPPRTSGRPVMLLAGSLALQDDGIGLALRAAAALDLTLVVRPHPRESPARYRRIARGLALPIDMRRKESIGELLMGADVLVTGPSTVIDDAAALGKPTILLARETTGYNVHLTTGIAIVATFDELIGRLTDALASGGARSCSETAAPAVNAERNLVDLCEVLVATAPQ